LPVLSIKTFGHKSLSQVAVPVRNIDAFIVELARDMVETMHLAPGLGLSAPQVDVSRRLITVDLSVGKNSQDLIILVNPEITEKDGEITAEEGCLSVPGIYEKVTRPARVGIKGLDMEGRERTYEATEILARVFCHEIDHLNGKLFLDRLSPLKRQLLKRKLRKGLETSSTQ
jgi:peptide deformylase